MDPESIARARLLPRWRDAWAQPRYFYQLGTVQLPFSVEQSTAIRSGATHLKMGDADATFAPGTTPRTLALFAASERKGQHS